MRERALPLRCSGRTPASACRRKDSSSSGSATGGAGFCAIGAGGGAALGLIAAGGLRSASIFFRSLNGDAKTRSGAGAAFGWPSGSSPRPPCFRFFAIGGRLSQVSDRARSTDYADDARRFKPALVQQRSAGGEIADRNDAHPARID